MPIPIGNLTCLCEVINLDDFGEVLSMWALYFELGVIIEIRVLENGD